MSFENLLFRNSIFEQSSSVFLIKTNILPSCLPSERTYRALSPWDISAHRCDPRKRRTRSVRSLDLSQFLEIRHFPRATSLHPDGQRVQHNAAASNRSCRSHLFPRPDPKELPPSDNDRESPRCAARSCRSDPRCATIPPICSTADPRQLCDRRSKPNVRGSSRSPSSLRLPSVRTSSNSVEVFGNDLVLFNNLRKLM